MVRASYSDDAEGAWTWTWTLNHVRTERRNFVCDFFQETCACVVIVEWISVSVRRSVSSSEGMLS